MSQVKNGYRVAAGTPLKTQYGFYPHEGIADGVGGVVHNSKIYGQVVRTSFAEFSCGQEVFICDDVPFTDGDSALARAMSAIGTPYALWSGNCQHLVRWAHGLEPESPAIQKAVMAASGLALAGFSKNSALQCVGLCMSAGAVTAPSGRSPVAHGLAWALAGGALAVLLGS